MSGDEARLPKWAQREMANLRMRLGEETARADLAEAAAGVVSDRAYGIHPTEPHETVHFGGVGAPSHLSFTVRLSRTDPAVLHVHAGGRLAVEPQASNTVDLRLRDR